jgi:hypothetical protein
MSFLTGFFGGNPYSNIKTLEDLEKAYTEKKGELNKELMTLEEHYTTRKSELEAAAVTVAPAAMPVGNSTGGARRHRKGSRKAHRKGHKHTRRCGHRKH